MNSVSIRYYGFSPSSSVRSLTKESIEELSQQAPSESRIQATLHRGEDAYHGLIHVWSSVAEFSATGESMSINRLVHKLIIQIQHQFKKWKTHRFEEDARY